MHGNKIERLRMLSIHSYSAKAKNFEEIHEPMLVEESLQERYCPKEVDVLRNMSPIPQIDGGNEMMEDNGTSQVKGFFAINCERDGVIQMVNFLRSLNDLWLTSSGHKLYFLHNNINTIGEEVRTKCQTIQY